MSSPLQHTDPIAGFVATSTGEDVDPFVGLGKLEFKVLGFPGLGTDASDFSCVGSRARVPRS